MKLDTITYMQKLHQRVELAIAPYHAFLLAYSGGLDSTVLLDILTTLRDNYVRKFHDRKFSLRACYVHHGLSQNSDRWASHCAYECYQRNIMFSITQIILSDLGDGIESAARNARYQILAKELKDNEVLLTAQHQDDQAETLFLALKRGSGPAGLAAMASDSSFRGHRLVRPLLNCSRAELTVYARKHRLHWIEDDSNNDLRFDRNFIRLKILPLLKKRWPQFVTTTVRTTQLCADQEILLNELLKKTLDKLIFPDGSLLITPLIGMSNAQRAAILRRWLASCSVRMPSRQKLTCLWQEVALSRRDAIAELRFGDRLVRRFHNRLHILPILLPNKKTVFFWPLEDNKLILPQGQGEISRRLILNNSISLRKYDDETNNFLNESASLIKDKMTFKTRITVSTTIVRAPLPKEKVSVRFGLVRGLLYISGRYRGRTMKKLWQELNIPPWKRNTTPLLFYNDTLISALGVFVTKEGEKKDSIAQWHLNWHQESDGSALNFVKGSSNNYI